MGYKNRSDSAADGYNFGLIVLNTDGTLIDETDVTQAVLKNAAGDTIIDQYNEFYKEDSLFWARVYEGSSSLFDKKLDSWSYFSFSAPSGTTLAAGDHTYEVTTADGSLLASTLTYQGDTVVAVPDTSAMTHQWLAGGSLKLTWQNSTGDYNDIKVRGRDENWDDLFIIDVPTTATTLTLPSWAIDEIEATYGAVPTEAYWYVEWRKQGDDGFENGRGISDSVQILNWPQN